MQEVERQRHRTHARQDYLPRLRHQATQGDNSYACADAADHIRQPTCVPLRLQEKGQLQVPARCDICRHQTEPHQRSNRKAHRAPQQVSLRQHPGQQQRKPHEDRVYTQPKWQES